MSRINIERMRQRVIVVQEAEAERARRTAATELWASPLGQWVASLANSLVGAFQPGAWATTMKPKAQPIIPPLNIGPIRDMHLPTPDEVARRFAEVNDRPEHMGPA